MVPQSLRHPLKREAWNCNATSSMEVLRKPLDTDVMTAAHAKRENHHAALASN